MRFWPSDKFTLSTSLSLEAAVNKIAAESEPFKMFRFGRPEHYFQGEIKGTCFELCRIIRYRNSFLPVVKGVIEAGPGRGALVRIEMGLSPFVWVFAGIWSAFVSFFAVAFLFAGFRGELGHDAWVLLPFAMLAFLYTMINVGFWIEAPKQKRKLIEIFQAEELHS